MTTEKKHVEQFDVFSPLGEPAVEAYHPANRPANLNGKTICEVTNGLFGSGVTFPKIREILKKRYPDIKIIPYTEFPIQGIHDSTEIQLERVKTTTDLLLKNGCDVLITGNGG